MNKPLQQQLEQDPILEAAADWFVELQAPDVEVERIARWQHWLAGDERHRAAYERIESLWNAVDENSTPAWPRPEEVMADRYDASTPVSLWQQQTSTPRKRRTWRPLLAAAGVLMALGLGAVLWTYRFAPADLAVETRAGEMRTVRLADGSTMTVGGRSSVSVRLTPQSRQIRLMAGEAFFSVAKDRARPFTVHAGATAVTAIGTAFNVRRADDDVVVAVAEGMVRIDAAKNANSPSSARHLTAGQQVSVAGGGTPGAQQTVNIDAVGGWREGKLHYLDEPLESVVADVRRYALRDIEITDPSIGALRVTGTVFESDIDSWLRTLTTAFPIRTTTDDAGRVLLERR